MSSTKNNNLNTSVEAGIDHDSFARIDSITDAAGNSTGPVLNNGYTDDLQPTLSGRLPDGDGLTLRVFCNNVVVGYADIGDEGYWTFKPVTPLEPGRTYDFQVILLDSAGSELLPSDTYTIHTTELNQDVAPAAPVITEVHDYAGDHQGVVAQGGKTDDSHPDVSGTAGAHDVVTLSVTSPSGITTVLGSTVADSNGNWDYQLTTAQSITATLGEWTFSATATNTVGTSDSSAGYSVETVGSNADDTTPPDAPILTGIYGTAEDGTKDGSGVNSGGTLHDATPELAGVAEPGTIIKIYEGSVLIGSTTTGADHRWAFDVSSALAEGKHTFFATATDAAGNTSTHSGNFVLNIDVPHIAPAIIEHVVDDHGSQTGDIKNGGTTDDKQPHLSGSAEAGSTVSIHQYDPYTGKEYVLGSVVASTNGDWDYQLAGGQVLQFGGESRFWITTLDNTGNKATSAVFKVTLVGENQDDTTAPDAPTIANYYDDFGDSKGFDGNGGTTDDTTPTLNGQAEANSIVKVYEGSTLLGSTTAKADGSWSYTTPVRAVGKHDFTATATDAAGNVSVHSGDFVVNIDVPDTDTTPPDAPVLTAVYGTAEDGTKDGSGANSGGTLHDATPELTGVAEPDSIVKIYDGSVLIGSTTAGANHFWAFDVSSALSEGKHTFFATATDAAGNTSGHSGNFVLNIDVPDTDTTPPDAPLITGAFVTAEDGSTDGSGATNGGTLHDTTPELAGVAEPGSIVNIYEGSVLIGSTTTGADRYWSFDVSSALSEGKHTFFATATDAAGNTSAHSGNFVVNIDIPDITPPDAPTIVNYYDDAGDSTGYGNNGTTTDDTTPTLYGHADAKSVVKIYDGSTLLGSVTADKNGNWNFTPSERSEGAHVFFATATDAAGNTSGKSAGFGVIIDASDTTPAVIEHVVDDHGSQTGDIRNGGTTDDKQPHLSGSAEAGSTVSIHQYDSYTGKEYVLGSVVASTDGHWDYQLVGGQVLQFGGQSRFWVTTLDNVGNKATSADFKVTLVGENQDDTTAPDTPTIANYYDDAGDSTGYDSNGGTTDDTTPTLNGQAEANSIVKVYEGSTLLGSTTAKADGSWSYTTPVRADGKHDFTATATDAAGNASAHSGHFVINVEAADTTPPDAPVIITAEATYTDGSTLAVGNGEATDDNTPDLRGNAEVGSIVKVYDGSAVIGSVMTDPNGLWKFDVSRALADGQHTFSVTATDAAGNTSAHSGHYVLDVETGPVGVSGFENFEEFSGSSLHFTSLETDSGLKIESAKYYGTRLSSATSGSQHPPLNTYIIVEDRGLITFTLPGVADTVSFFGWTPDNANIHAYDANGHEIAASISMREATAEEDKTHFLPFDKYTITADAGQHIASFTLEGIEELDDVSWNSAGVHAAQQSALLTSSDAVDHHDILTLSQVDDSHKSTAAVDITDHVQNTLHLTLNDILSEAHPNLFVQDGKQQLAVTGDQGDVVELKVDDLAHNTWQDSGAVTAGGIQYEVYQHAGSDVELLVQHGLELHQVS